jgi:hypothetical protein
MIWTEQTIHFIDFEGAIAGGILEYGVVTLLGGEMPPPIFSSIPAGKQLGMQRRVAF